MATAHFSALSYFLLLVPTTIAFFGLLLICAAFAKGGAR
jgi:hypothetical protein